MTDDELIKAVVQEVMGWSATATHYPESVVKRDCGGTTTYMMHRDHFNPLTNANHWMMVVERMRELGFNVFLGWKFKNRINFCEIQRESYPVPMDTWYEEHEIIGHAICLAALKAVRHG